MFTADGASLLGEYKGMLERFIKYKIANSYVVEDIIQETYLAAYQNFTTLKKKGLFAEAEEDLQVDLKEDVL